MPDVIVVGAAGAGMTAAIVAARAGLNVLVIEKSDLLGGATAWSGGGLWVPASGLESAIGVEDRRDDAERYVRTLVGPGLREDLFAAFLDAAPRMIAYLHRETQVAFEVQRFSPDQRPDLAGALAEGRVLVPVNYDARKLGPWLRKLRHPLAEFNAPAGLMLSRADLPHVLRPTGSFASFRHVAGLIARHAVDRVRFGRGTRLTMGTALAARLLRSALDAGVRFQTGVAMRALMQEGGRVTGVEIETDGRREVLYAACGVVLATGGFSANPAMRRQYIPYADQHISLMPDTHQGDGIAAALRVGAALDEGNRTNAAYTVISVHRKSDGTVRKFPHLFLDRPKPGCIAVNRAGRRFGNEAAIDFGEAMPATGSVPAWLVCDHRFIRRYGLGLVYPGGFGLRRLVRDGYVQRADSLHALAEKLGVDPAGLAESVRLSNGYAQSGIDLDFGKGSSAGDRMTGDRTHQPNPCLGPIEQPPFYAVQIHPGDASTTLGLRIDDHANVLDTQGHPIAGLYACGLDMNSIWRGSPPGAGSNNTLSLTFGYIAGRAMVERAGTARLGKVPA